MADKREMYLKQWAQDLADQKASGLMRKEFCPHPRLSKHESTQGIGRNRQ